MKSVPSSNAALRGYADSVDSSPRSRGGDSWAEPYPLSAFGGSRLRLMCSYSSHIVPYPTDKSLCYLGGETRIVVVDRQASLSDPHAKLPNEDLGSLISVSTDEDLENMIDEYDRIVAVGSAGSGNRSTGGGSSRTSRIRLFLFATASPCPTTGSPRPRLAQPPTENCDPQSASFVDQQMSSPPSVNPLICLTVHSYSLAEKSKERAAVDGDRLRGRGKKGEALLWILFSSFVSRVEKGGESGCFVTTYGGKGQL